jgi:hypothetical protein
MAPNNKQYCCRTCQFTFRGRASRTSPCLPTYTRAVHAYAGYAISIIIANYFPTVLGHCCCSSLSSDQDPTYFFPNSDVSNHLMLCCPYKEQYLLQTIQQQIHDLLQYSAIPQDPPLLHPYAPPSNQQQCSSCPNCRQFHLGTCPDDRKFTI